MSAATDAARQAVADARAVYEAAIVNAPRSMQTHLGPSEIGNACDRCLIHLLAGTPKVETRVPWLPTVGTAVHEWAEAAIIRHLAETGSARWLPEVRVNVGTLRGRDVWGTCDLFDRETGTVIDLKVVGKTTLDKVRADGSGASLTYRRQVQLYAAGLAAAGDTVNAVAIWFLPRNGLTLSTGRMFVAEFDPQVAADTLARANRFATWIDTFGAQQVLDGAPPHTAAEFSCSTFADGAMTSPPSPDAFLGVA